MHMTILKRSGPPMPPSNEPPKQEPFSHVAPVLKAALLLGICGGFLLATVLTITRILPVSLGTWWAALAQAHGHLQLYGWAGLFVLGVALHFLPRLRGTPLVAARLIPWMLVSISVSMILRAFCQPLLTVYPATIWRVGLVGSGILEMGALALIVWSLVLTATRGPRPTTRLAYWSVFPFLVGAFCALGLASIINLVNVIQAGNGGLVMNTGDMLNVTLGLFGFLVPVALAMSARSLPMYAGLDGFPRRILWPLAGAYFAGLVLMGTGTIESSWASISMGIGSILIGAVVMVFIGIFLALMRRRGRIPQRVAKLSPEPAALTRSYQHQIKKEQTDYGPFVGLVASAYLWALLGALLLLIDGASILITGSELVSFDAIRHCFALGFIALLICGIAPRMLPSFSGGKMLSPRLVSATLWLGNIATLLRVGSLLLAPLFVITQGFAIETFLFSLSGPCGLALALCLAINLWPALRSSSGDIAGK
ncbi:hypothetical protein KSF_010900 [Reticulibacter mediterranei]|uniref:NnrS family protein n=1 Tax=Reticulibacter mediterranei TaxID=2778369 RepID=A0A8J3MYN5_9CHLR|nr:hypothetical protein [Reticulibacter mediterranei]GHO91042.1 hypothetical protein KSF_010900 [Reticulibacter mediterranei]